MSEIKKRVKFTLEFEAEIDEPYHKDDWLYDRYRFILFDALARGKVSVFDGKGGRVYATTVKQKFRREEFK